MTLIVNSNSLKTNDDDTNCRRKLKSGDTIGHPSNSNTKLRIDSKQLISLKHLANRMHI